MGVLCSGASARAVGLLFPRFSDEMWDVVINTISGNAALTGSLLTESFSPDIVDELQLKGIHLIPDHYRSVRAFCHCTDEQNPCIHIAAAWYFLAEILDEDPWVLFLLHGMTREEVLRRIEEHRGEISHQIPSSNEEQLLISQETGIPDSYDASGFFSCMGNADDVRTPVPERIMNPVMLLGPAPFRLGGKNLAKRIEHLYPLSVPMQHRCSPGRSKKGNVYQISPIAREIPFLILARPSSCLPVFRRVIPLLYHASALCGSHESAAS
jgi:hypothetical protein